MYFKQLLDERNGCASYVIASRESGDAAIVDPSVDLEQYESLLRERGFTLRYVIDTHIHADHVSLARPLAAKHDAELCLHEAAKVTYPHRSLKDGEELPLGELKLRALHTPGHRPELISILVIDPAHSPEPAMVLTGDSLLAGDVGRPDFGGGDANAQYDSVGRLLRLPDWVAVFPGHFEGPCGKSMSGQPSTTVGYERLYNPMLQLDREPFVSSLTGEVPPRPLNMTAIEATNRGTMDAPWAMLTSSPQVSEVSVDELADRLAQTPNAVLLDVREPAEYTSGHVPGALNLPQAELAARLDEAPRDRALYVICRSGSRSMHSAQFLAQRGITATNVRGGTMAWKSSGKPLAKGAAPGGKTAKAQDAAVSATAQADS